METPVSHRVLHRLYGAAFVVWAVTAAVACAYLLAGHLVSLPTPARTARARLPRALADLRSSGAARPLAVHVLLGSCGCSRRVLAHLAERGVAAGFDEHVILVDADAQTAEAGRLSARGFGVSKLSSAELQARYAIESAPLLIVLGSDDELAYLGGYGDRKQTAEIRDVEILDQIRARTPVRALPTFGCAVSAKLKRTLDPLGLRN